MILPHVIQIRCTILSRVGVTSYQDITDCLKLVIKAVRFGQIKPWVCNLHFVISCLPPYECKTLQCLLSLLYTALCKECRVSLHRSTGTAVAL